MNILITGGAGYIGSELIDHLIKDNKVTVYDNLMHGGNQILSFFRYSGFKFIKGDIRNLSCLKEATKDHDIIIHWQH